MVQDVKGSLGLYDERNNPINMEPAHEITFGNIKSTS